MSSILVLHSSGPDLDALVSFLESSAGEIHVTDDPRALGPDARSLPTLPEPVVLLIHEDLWPTEVAPGMLENHATFVIGKSRDVAPFTPRARFPIPYFLADVRAAVRAALITKAKPIPPPSEAQEVRPHGGLLPEPETHALLRSLCHGLKNPLGGAVGWMQMLEEPSQADLQKRAVTNARAQLAKMDLMLDALSMLSRRLDAQPLTDLWGIAEAARVAASREGWRVRIQLRDKLQPVSAPRDALSTALRLLLYALLEGRRDDRELVLELTPSMHGVTLALEDTTETLRPLSTQWHSFAALLAQVRMPLALAWALLVHSTESVGGAAAITRRGAGVVLQLSLRTAEQEAESST